MAVIQDVITPGTTAGTKGEFIALDGGGVGLYPVARYCHRGEAAISAPGASNYIRITLEFPLPGNMYWQLQHLAVSCTPQTIRLGRYKQYTCPDGTNQGAQYATEWPFVPSYPYYAYSGDTTRITWGLSTYSQMNVGGSQYASPMTPEDPRAMMFYQPEGGSTPEINMGADSVNTAAGVLSFSAEWIGYSFEQMRNAEMYFGVRTRH